MGLLTVDNLVFEKTKTTVDAVDELVREILSAYEKKSFSQAKLCNLSKDFDCVTHEDLIQKLYHYEIRDFELKFFESYLSNRTQKRVIDGCLFEETKVSLGVLQGSVLAPFCFYI